MNKSRLEAFSDGVIAIIITIMVLEMKIPSGSDLASLKSVFPVFITYVFSFLMVGIYWNNHHHLFQAVHKVNGQILWANMFLLFWLSLFPFATGWMGNNHLTKYPVALYGFVLLMAAVSYGLLVRAIIKYEGKDAEVSIAVQKDKKGNVSILLYCIAILFAFIYPLAGVIIFVVVGGIWLIPDKRIEKVLLNKK